ncbi:MAG: hypothetical protein ACR2NZ_19590 [Rubripirellula sp.]
MTPATESPLPIESWTEDMVAAIERICDLGLEILRVHSIDNAAAQRIAEEWSLTERMADEHQALNTLFANARSIVLAVEELRARMNFPELGTEGIATSLDRCSQTIEDNLPGIEDAFLVSRHSALDLLRWIQHDAVVDESDLPGRYRASYAQLVSYSPVFKPHFEQLGHRLLELGARHVAAAEIGQLLSGLSRYNAVAESARSFVRSIVEPQLEMVFHETEGFVNDWKAISPSSERAELATELNDCCQLLLYDQASFDQRTEAVHVPLGEGVDASLFRMSYRDRTLLFTVDQDPVFSELVITLLRVVTTADASQAIEASTRSLYSGLGSDSDGQQSK